MSARKPKRNRKWAKTESIREHQRAQASRKDTRAANAEYAPVRNHKVRNLVVRLSDLALGETGGVWPVQRWDPASGEQYLIFVQGFRHWPGRTFDADATEIRIRDFEERPKYSTVEL